jgi:hypothetical protein
MYNSLVLYCALLILRRVRVDILKLWKHFRDPFSFVDTIAVAHI